jgi:mono/diheme cytochrome c family protein
MSKTPFVIFGIFAAVCVLVIPYLALGKEGDEEAATVKVADRDQAAKELFAVSCGRCHTLAAAGTEGVVGPDLDQQLVPTGTNDDTRYDGIYSQVLRAVTCGIGGRMPKGVIEGENAKQVARFVAAYAGQIDKGPTVDTATMDTPDPQACPPPSGE